jgi:hypothetical protein
LPQSKISPGDQGVRVIRSEYLRHLGEQLFEVITGGSDQPDITEAAASVEEDRVGI